MALNWNEIKERAIQFSKEWENDFNEDAEAKSFMDAFFNVFGVPRRRVATFEINIKKEDGKQGFIDLLWKGTILIEFKSRGKDLDKAHQQAKDYFSGLKDHELPKYILVSDFARFRLYDLEEGTTIEFKLNELVKNVQHFGFISGYKKKIFHDQDPANIKAAELMGKLHDRLKENGYDTHQLEVYLVRLLFCLFAEDTTIFSPQQFQDYIEQRTNIDGSDLASKLQELFQVLNTAKEKRFKNLDEQLADFPYVNGKLFEEQLLIAGFDSKMRQALLDCCYLDWSKISPAIFGSMFQSVMKPTERRNLGAHYTSEKNILKLIKPLFLDELWKEFESVKENKNKLQEFHKKISTLKFLDPACGCGNFLVITYRELRKLELEIIKTLLFKHDKIRREVASEAQINISQIAKLDVDQFYGIEYEEFPARIAEVAMWLVDHQMNMAISAEFGQYYVRLPLKKAATIVHGNALQIDWQSLLKLDGKNYDFISNQLIVSVAEPITHYEILNIKTQKLTKEKAVSKTQNNDETTFNYIIGNPPFSGAKIMKQHQRDEIIKEFDNSKGSGLLDYVAGWYIKAAKYIQNTKIKVAFVSTNSIVQGEQTAILWGQLIKNYNIKIHFAHRTFKWSNEAKGNAAVYCVIIGFANFDSQNKIIFEYDDIKGEAHEIKAKNINPYLVDAKNIFIEKRRKPLCKVPEISFGSMPNDGGYLLLNDDEKKSICKVDKIFAKFIKPLVSGQEFLNGEKKWCLWLEDFNPSEIDKSPELIRRIKIVKKIREDSNREATKKLALFPYQFGEIRQPKSDYIFIPLTSSENRKTIPMGFFSKEVIANNTGSVIANATLYHFGVLQSSMHIAWVKSVCGRLKSDFRYSNEIVYNNYPWPESITDKQTKAIELAAQKVLDARNNFADSSLATLYDTVKMPSILVKAHLALDKLVDAAYSRQSFSNEAKRLEFLFELYEKYTADLFTKENTKKKK
ncbi:MAG TPA: DNA methyltransferase [Bacteroidia bacterium]|nr:DNA methyltransferase [Bacteroidia bacterium]